MTLSLSSSLDVARGDDGLMELCELHLFALRDVSKLWELSSMPIRETRCSSWYFPWIPFLPTRLVESCDLACQPRL